MATYDELLTIATTEAGDSVRRRLRVAVVVAADIVRLETPGSAARRAWARMALQDPDTMAKRMEWAVLAQNRTATVAQIVSATDEQVQSAVNAAIDLVAGV